jgi:hypothetical protein
VRIASSISMTFNVLGELEQVNPLKLLPNCALNDLFDGIDINHLTELK